MHPTLIYCVSGLSLWNELPEGRDLHLSPALGTVLGILSTCLINEQVLGARWEPPYSHERRLKSPGSSAVLAGGGFRDELDLAAHGVRLKIAAKDTARSFHYLAGN